MTYAVNDIGAGYVLLAVNQNATALSDAVVAGFDTSSTKAIVYQGGVVTTLPLLSGSVQGALAIGSAVAYSVPYNVSADGTIIGGCCTDGGAVFRPVYWSYSAGSWTIHALAEPMGYAGWLRTTYENSYPTPFGMCGAAVSSDGLHFAAIYSDGGHNWIIATWAGGTPSTISFGTDQPNDASVGISQTASYVYTTGATPIYYVSGVGPTTLPVTLPSTHEFVAYTATGASNDGSIGVYTGSDASTETYLAVYYYGGTLYLLPAPGGATNYGALGTVGTAVYIVGGSDNGAALWVSAVAQILPALSGATADSSYSAWGVNDTATVIVGFGNNASATLHGVIWTTGSPPPPPDTFPYSFLTCGNGFTVTQPIVQMYGFDHLIGMTVVGLADGVPIGPFTVAADGSVTLPFPASDVKIGLAFLPQLQTPYLDVGNPTMQGRRKAVTAVTVRVESSGALQIGTNQPDGSTQVPQQIAPPWTNMNVDPIQVTQTYQSPSGQTVTKLFTGDLRMEVTAQWAKPGQVAMQQPLPLPMNVLAAIPEVLEGDTTEQGYAQEPRPQQSEDRHSRQVRGPGSWMLKR